MSQLEDLMAAGLAPRRRRSTNDIDTWRRDDEWSAKPELSRFDDTGRTAYSIATKMLLSLGYSTPWLGKNFVGRKPRVDGRNE
jgi:hypothetical protein